MDQGLKTDFVDALMRVPASATFLGRGTLLSGISCAAGLNRDANSARVDLLSIVDQLIGVDPPSLLVLLENAVSPIPEGTLSRTFDQLRSRLGAAIHTASGATSHRKAGRPRTAAATGRAAPRARARRAFDDVEPWSFDLTGVIRTCTNSFDGPSGLFGFGLRPFAYGYPGYLCKRLRNELIDVELCLLGSLGGPVLDDRTDLLQRMKGAVSQNRANVLVAVHSSDQGRTERFWKTVREEFDVDGRLPCRMVVVISAPPTVVFPAKIVELERPEFTPQDVREWVSRIVQSAKLDKDRAGASKLVDFFASSLRQKCTGDGGGIDGDRAYQFINHVGELLKGFAGRRMTLEDLRLEIDSWG